MLVAVYGSLKKGFGNSGLLSESILIGSGETLPHYDMLSFGGYPGVINGNEKIQVEVYEIDDSKNTLKNLDSLEGHPSYYRREPVEIHLDSGERTIAWMYTVRHHERYYTHPRYTVKDEKNRLEWFESQKYRR